MVIVDGNILQAIVTVLKCDSIERMQLDCGCEIIRGRHSSWSPANDGEAQLTPCSDHTAALRLARD